MNSELIRNLEAFFAEFPDTVAVERPAPWEIDQASTELGVPFPADYRQFLLSYGGAVVGPYPVFGLRPVESLEADRWSVVSVTHEYRSEGIAELSEWVVFSKDHAGNPIGFDATGAVWVFDHNFGGVTRHSDNFEAYLKYCLSFVD